MFVVDSRYCFLSPSQVLPACENKINNSELILLLSCQLRRLNKIIIVIIVIVCRFILSVLRAVIRRKKKCRRKAGAVIRRPAFPFSFLCFPLALRDVDCFILFHPETDRVCPPRCVLCVLCKQPMKYRGECIAPVHLRLRVLFSSRLHG